MIGSHLVIDACWPGELAFNNADFMSRGSTYFFHWHIFLGQFYRSRCVRDVALPGCMLGVVFNTKDRRICIVAKIGDRRRVSSYELQGPIVATNSSRKC